MATRKPDPKRIAAILAFAQEHGDRKACQRFKVSPRTITNYRQRQRTDSAVAAECGAAAEKVQRRWLDEAGAARSKLLDRIMKLAENETNLRDVVGALKIVSDSMLAYEVVNPDGGRTRDGAGMAEPGGAPAPAPVGSHPDPAVH